MSSSDPLSSVISSIDKNSELRPKKPKSGKVGPQAFGSDKSRAREAVDRVNIEMREVYKSLTVLADEVIKKLNELLKEDLPEGIASLKPEDHTPEATAERIVAGVTGFFNVFAKQNPELEGEELVTAFMDTIRGGVKQGYDEAAGILDSIGAFEFDGVQQGIEETMRLVDEKLSAFEDELRKSLGLVESSAEEGSESEA